MRFFSVAVVLVNAVLFQVDAANTVCDPGPKDCLFSYRVRFFGENLPTAGQKSR